MAVVGDRGRGSRRRGDPHHEPRVRDDRRGGRRGGGRRRHRPGDQAGGTAYLGHDVVTGIDAGGAADAFHLQAVADINAGGAHLHTQSAIHAVTQSLGLRIIVA